MKTRYIVAILLSFGFLSFANANSDKNVDCLILEDENSIICKYTHERINTDKIISVQWIEPDSKITRERDMVIPAHHGSIYDYRYIEGRTKGTWTFKVIDNGDEYQTNFEIK